MFKVRESDSKLWVLCLGIQLGVSGADERIRHDLASTQSRIWARNLILIVSNNGNNILPRVHYPKSHSLPFFHENSTTEAPCMFLC